MAKLNFFIVLLCVSCSFSKKYSDKEKPEWAKKDIRDFSDADMERYKRVRIKIESPPPEAAKVLTSVDCAFKSVKDISCFKKYPRQPVSKPIKLFDQWEEDEEPLPEDEQPEYMRKPPTVDFSKLDTSNPEALLQATKKGQTLMMFVTVANKPSRARAEELTKIWQTGLWSNHIQAERYLIDDDRAIFMFKDGSQAWEAKEYLLEQDELKDVQLESQTYLGKNPDVKNKAVRDEL